MPRPGGRAHSVARSADEMSPSRILRTLDFGLMMSIAYPMRRDEREAVAAFLGTRCGRRRASAECVLQAGRLDHVRSIARELGSGGVPRTPTRGFSRRSAPACPSKTSARLELKWAYGFAGDVIAFAAPTRRERHAVRRQRRRRRASARRTNRVFALALPGERSRARGDDRGDRGRGRRCSSATRTAASTPSTPRTGQLRWQTRVEQHEATRLTGSFAVHDGVAFVPAASWEETRSHRSGLSVLHVSRQRDGAFASATAPSSGRRTSSTCRRGRA